MCSIEGCDLEEYKDGKCILHCNKEKIFNDSIIIKKFWNQLRNEIKKESSFLNLRNLHFPSSEEVLIIEDNRLKKDSNFFKKGEFYLVDKMADFSYSKFYGKLDFYNLKFNGDVLFKNCIFVDAIFINIVCEKSITFESSKFFNRFVFQNLIVNLQIDITNIIFNESSHIKFISISTNDLKISQVFNDSKKVFLSDLKVNRLLCLHYCDLNNFLFDNVDLSQSDLSFHGISVRSTIFSGVNWGSVFDKKFEFKNRSIVRDIKHSLESQGDIIEANKFYTLEMKEREKELDDDKKNGKSLFEWLLFKVHALSSNHSQDWLLALFWILSFSFGYSFIKYFNNKYLDNSLEYILVDTFFISTILLSSYFIVNTKKVNNYILILAYYSIYIIFTEDYTLTEFSKNVNPFSILTEAGTITFLELIYKIAIAYLIYQLIISIRQNTRRK